MSFSYDRYDRRQSSNRRTTFGFWVPLVFTVTVATAGVVAWIWSERREDEEDSDDADLSYGEDRDGTRPPGPEGARDTASMSQGVTHEEDSFIARMSGAIRRTPSPQQLFDTLGKRAAAGVAAAGAVVGGALSSIREEDKDDFGDHSRWSEEAIMRRNVEAQAAQSASAVTTNASSFGASLRAGPQASGGRRKIVVIVVSAESTLESMHEEEQGAYHTEHASILSHLPDTDFSKTQLFVLIYTPSLKSRPTSSSIQAPPSLGSSYSALSTPAQTPGEELTSIAPHPDDSTIYTPAQTATTPALSAKDPDNSLWNSLHVQALRLVETPTMVMPFTAPTGHVHMLKHLGPDVVYMVEALAGANGTNIEQIKSWVGQVIVVVGGDGAGLGGLVDTDDEGGPAKAEGGFGSGARWWETGDMVGLGKGVEVVDGVRIREDFERRVGGRE
ncbi:hypothetical protein K432DRAFT_357451 [Lepidopterella palustris CBS 459.81]|uniref:Peroxin 22-like protein n=1 Tax=Lepidopterella palustris CBS 459.81 TaxID=1314670 RepID=A0A8E2E634_9PEZI|nr:hypothetical protein K432DRAFT_357451 [Lepidopterella palustris CBS 459.81]